MRSAHPSFIGVVIGLLAVLLLPAQYIHDKFDLYYFIVVFGGFGFLVGWMAGHYKNRP